MSTDSLGVGGMISFTYQSSHFTLDSLMAVPFGSWYCGAFINLMSMMIICVDTAIFLSTENILHTLHQESLQDGLVL